MTGIGMRHHTGHHHRRSGRPQTGIAMESTLLT
jgi:hypothetical protein